MNSSFASIPFYIKFSIIFVGISAFGFVIYEAQGILIPLSFAFFFTALLEPIVDLLRRINVPRTLAIAIATLVAYLAIIGVMYFLLMELSTFQESLPQFKQKLDAIIAEIKTWVSIQFHVSPAVIDAYVENLTQKFTNEMGAGLGNKVVTGVSLIFVWLLIPVYIFLFLYYQPLIFAFIQRATESKNLSKIGETMVEINKMVQFYLRGLVLEALIIAGLNSIALLILGVDYAILLGVTGAIVNVIPYVGGFISIAMPMFVAFVSQNSFQVPLLVLLLLSFIQFLDNHFIVPFIVASRVRINAFIGLIAILSCGELFGISGMLLAIIYMAILKIIFDKIDSLNHYGILLGTYVPATSRFFKILESFKKK
jgi:predicted PurR-regulated permease PerM